MKRTTGADSTALSMAALVSSERNLTDPKLNLCDKKDVGNILEEAMLDFVPIRAAF